jgi:hypothetical protein
MKRSVHISHKRKEANFKAMREIVSALVAAQMPGHPDMFRIGAIEKY